MTHDRENISTANYYNDKDLFSIDSHCSPLKEISNQFMTFRKCNRFASIAATAFKYISEHLTQSWKWTELQITTTAYTLGQNSTNPKSEFKVKLVAQHTIEHIQYTIAYTLSRNTTHGKMSEKGQLTEK